jgi:hypothetical protein
MREIADLRSCCGRYHTSRLQWCLLRADGVRSVDAARSLVHSHLLARSLALKTKEANLLYCPQMTITRQLFNINISTMANSKTHLLRRRLRCRCLRPSLTPYLMPSMLTIRPLFALAFMGMWGLCFSVPISLHLSSPLTSLPSLHKSASAISDDITALPQHKRSAPPYHISPRLHEFEITLAPATPSSTPGIVLNQCDCLTNELVA